MEKLAAVALLNGVQARRLSPGQAGTIVERLAPDIHEVEFSDRQGRAYASLAVPGSNLIRRQYRPVRQTGIAVPEGQ